jgi:chromosome segregation ATPase
LLRNHEKNMGALDAYKKKLEDNASVVETSNSLAREVRNDMRNLEREHAELLKDHEKNARTLEAYKKKWEDTELLVENTRSALSQKESELRAVRLEAEQLNKALTVSEETARAKAAALEELSEEAARLRAAGAEYEKSKKLVEQLKEKLKLWKNQ